MRVMRVMRVVRVVRVVRVTMVMYKGSHGGGICKNGKIGRLDVGSRLNWRKLHLLCKSSFHTKLLGQGCSGCIITWHDMMESLSTNLGRYYRAQHDMR